MKRVTDLYFEKKKGDKREAQTRYIDEASGLPVTSDIRKAEKLLVYLNKVYDTLSSPEVQVLLENFDDRVKNLVPEYSDRGDDIYTEFFGTQTHIGKLIFDIEQHIIRLKGGKE